MLSLPDTPFPIIGISSNSISDQPQYLREILQKRLSINTNNSNTALLISNLEDYLNLIFSTILNNEDVQYTEVLKFSQDVILGDAVSWNLPMTKKKGRFDWKLSDEIIIVLVNLIFSYIKRSSEILDNVLNDLDQNGLTEKESLQIWMNSFKLYKTSNEYLNFLKQNHPGLQPTESLYETSLDFTNFLESLISASIQLTFLSKAIWSLKNQEYDINLNKSLNYSTLSRISIYVRDQLGLMVSNLKSHSLTNDVSRWLNFIESVSRLNKAYIGTFSSLESYKVDQIGKSIGFLNIAIENVTSKRVNGQNDDMQDEFSNNQETNKLKKKFLSLKQKINTPSSTERKNSASVEKALKLNEKLLSSFQKTPPLQQSTVQLLQLVEALRIKYTIDNNNLKFDKVLTADELYMNHLPTGRPVPITDSDKTWIPYIARGADRANHDAMPERQYY